MLGDLVSRRNVRWRRVSSPSLHPPGSSRRRTAVMLPLRTLIGPLASLSLAPSIHHLILMPTRVLHTAATAARRTVAVAVGARSLASR